MAVSISTIEAVLGLISSLKKKDRNVIDAQKSAGRDDDQDLRIAALETRVASLEGKLATILRVVELMAEARKVAR